MVWFKKRMVVTILGLAFLTVSIGVGTYFIGGRRDLRSLAGGAETPKEVRITNLTENSFSVSWVTERAVVGSVSYGTDPNNLDTLVLEDQLGAQAAMVHHVSVKPLKPGTKYYFKMTSGKSQYGMNGEPYTIATPATIGTPPPPETVYGSVRDAEGKPLSDRAVVYIDIPGVGGGSAVVNPVSGNWSFSVSTLRNTNLTSYATIVPSTSLQITVRTGTGKAATTTALSKAKPVPTMTIAK